MAATQVQFKIECEAGAAILVMDKKQDYIIMDWQSAKALSEAIANSISFLVAELKPVDRTTTQWELSQVRLAGHKGKVAMITPWTDRLKYTSLQAFALLGQGLNTLSQEMKTEEQDKSVGYNEGAFVEAIKGLRVGITQRV